MDELYEVECVVSFGHNRGAMSLDDAIKVEQKLADETAKHIRETTGIKCTGKILLGRGATGPDTILALLKMILDIKDLIEITLVLWAILLKLIKIPWESVKSYDKPDITVSLNITSQHEWEVGDSFSSIAMMMVHLKAVLALEITLLAEHYPSFKFRQSVKLSLPRNSFNVQYSLNAKQNTPYYNRRMTYIISKLDLEQGLDLEVTINRFRLFKHNAQIRISKEGVAWVYFGKSKCLYSYFSRTMSGGYFRKMKKMTQNEYHLFVDKVMNSGVHANNI